MSNPTEPNFTPPDGETPKTTSVASESVTSFLNDKLAHLVTWQGQPIPALMRLIEDTPAVLPEWDESARQRLIRTECCAVCGRALMKYRFAMFLGVENAVNRLTKCPLLHLHCGSWLVTSLWLPKDVPVLLEGVQEHRVTEGQIQAPGAYDGLPPLSVMWLVGGVPAHAAQVNAWLQSYHKRTEPTCANPDEALGLAACMDWAVKFLLPVETAGD